MLRNKLNLIIIGVVFSTSYSMAEDKTNTITYETIARYGIGNSIDTDNLVYDRALTSLTEFTKCVVEGDYW